MVGLAAGMVVLAALSMLMITTLRSTARVSARVDATQRARVALTNLTEELHSACILPQIVPVFPESGRTQLAFIRASGPGASDVSPAATKTVIKFENKKLIQTDSPWVGTYPKGSAGAPTERLLLDEVAPISPSGPIFRYYRFAGGKLEEIPLAGTGTLGSEGAVATIQVQVSLNATPTSRPVADAGADSSVQASAPLRLTPPSFNETAAARPCQ
ncbi:MAG: hypothetical protein AB7V58_14210 [Solirubrobacterales bacterium]